MEFNEIMSELKKKVYRPVYFLMGDEPYFIDMISDYIEHQVLDEMEKEFNQSILYGRDISTAEVIAAAKRFPMMSEHQVVVIKEAPNIRLLRILKTLRNQPYWSFAINIKQLINVPQLLS
jgi:DNA polymerase III subunit delta